jgi:hypothetical protein
VDLVVDRASSRSLIRDRRASLSAPLLVFFITLALAIVFFYQQQQTEIE